MPSSEEIHLENSRQVSWKDGLALNPLLQLCGLAVEPSGMIFP